MLATLNMKSKGRTKCDMHGQRLSLRKVVTQLARQSCETSTSLYGELQLLVSTHTERACTFLVNLITSLFMHCIRKLKSVSTNERAIFFTTAITVRSIVIFLSDIFDEVDEQIKKHAGLQANCVGGGRIEHDPDEKTIKVYGYSQGFGKADHQVSVDLLKKKYPDYNITCSDEVIKEMKQLNLFTISFKESMFICNKRRVLIAQSFRICRASDEVVKNFVYLTMFSRAAKSVVKSVGSCRIHIGEKNFKIALIGDAREISQTLSQLLRNNVKLNAFALYDVAAINRPLPFYNFYDEQPSKPIPSEMPTMRKKSYLEKGNHSNAVINSTRQTDNNQGNNGRNQTEKLVEALYHLPIAEEAPAFNGPLIPIEELMPKAGNACSRMCLYARVLGETSSSNMETWQRDYAVPIRKWFFDLTYPSFQEYDLNFIPEAKIAKKDRSIKKTRKIEHLSYSAFVAKENNHQLLPTFLLNHGEKPARRLMKKFRNDSILPNRDARCKGTEKSTDWSISAVLLNNKLRLLHEIYGRIIFPLSSLNFINYKRENNREVGSFNRDSETTDDTLNVVEQENWIRRTCSKIKSILPDLQAKIRFHSTTASDSYCSENIFVVNQVISFSDIISNAILFTSRDDEADKSRTGIRRKIEEFCMQRKKTLKKNKENDMCKKREKLYEKRDRECQKKEKKTACTGKIKWAGKKQNAVSCNKKKSSCNEKYPRDCHIPCEAEIQEDPCKPKKDTYVPKIKEDPCAGPHSTKQEQTCYELHDASPCRLDKKKDIKKKEEIKKPDCSQIKYVDPCKKKEEIKKPDCSQIKYVDPCEKKTCPPVKKPQPENLTMKISKSEIIAERRESSSMTSAVKITGSGKPIESNRIQTNRDFLSIINSCQQFTGINFVKDFQQDFNSTVNHKDCSDFSFLHKHFVAHPCYCSNQSDEFEESKLSYDDYFPQGEEYEDEIGIDEQQLDKKIKKPSKEPPIVDDEYDNFEPMLLFENNKYVNGGPLTRFITRVHFSSIEELTEPDRITLMSEKVSNKDAIEKLETLIEKVAEFKRRVFRSKHEALKIETTTDERKEKKIVNENKDNESMKIETTNQ
ncbi:JANA protein, partial [Acromyrmex insinuator]